MIIIPARYASTRFPGKPLADIGGISMIERVYRQCLLTRQQTIVATDDERIFKHVKQFGGEVMMTSAHHQSGTDRCAEVYKAMNCPDDIVVNVQGDEPFIRPLQINSLIELFKRDEVLIATLCKPIEDSEILHNPHVVKLVKSTAGKAIYFSRHPLPFMRDAEQELWHRHHTYFKHIGIYAFRGNVLSEVTALPPSSLEMAESLEQLRWIENGYEIYTAETHFESPAIDTPEDLKKVLASYINNE